MEYFKRIDMIEFHQTTQETAADAYEMESSFPKGFSDFDLSLINDTVKWEINARLNSDQTNNADKTGIEANEINSIGKKLSELIEAREPAKSNDYFISQQKWICYITAINDNSFNADLYDVDHPGGTYEKGEFDKREVSVGDMELLKLGATFYWSIGFSSRGSQVEKKSLIRFQRLANWSEEEYNEAIDKADELFDYFTR